MSKEFTIYPKKCKDQCSELTRVENKLKKCITSLESVQGVIAGLEGSGYSTVVSTLKMIMQDIQQESKSAVAMKDGLQDCANLYILTETKISGKSVALKEIELLIEEWMEIIEEVAGDSLLLIGDVRSSLPGVFLESLLTKGIFKDNVLKHMDQLLSGTYITTSWKNGMMNLRLHHNGMDNRAISEWLSEHLGGSWDDFKARNMGGDGFSVYNRNGGVTRQMRYFDNITDAELSKYLKGWPEQGNTTRLKNGLNQFTDTFVDEFKVWKQFMPDDVPLDTMGKIGKGLGAFGTVLTVGTDIADNFYDPESEEWSFSGNQLADCTADIVIDIGAGAGSAAAGAAIGSFFAPPVGTVVGAGVGIAVDVLANNVKLFDVDGDGEKDSAIDTVKIGVHAAIDGIEKGIDEVVDWGSDVVDDIGGWFDKTFSF